MKAIIVDSANTKLDAELHTEMLDWAKSLGVDTRSAIWAHRNAEAAVAE